MAKHRKHNIRLESFIWDIFENKSNNIGAIDCEFFYGASNKRIKAQTSDMIFMNEHCMNLLPLYNIGVCSPYFTNNILVKHPCLSIKQRFNLFKNRYNQDKMFKYLQNCVFYAIRMETNIHISKHELDLDTIDYYFDMLALDYHEIISIISKYCQEEITLLHHYCQADATFIYDICELLEFKEINKINFQNTRQFCHAVFPIDKVVSHSLSYFIDNIIKEQKKRPNDLHVAVYDAEMLLLLFNRFKYLISDVIN